MKSTRASRSCNAPRWLMSAAREDKSCGTLANSSEGGAAANHWAPESGPDKVAIGLGWM